MNRFLDETLRNRFSFNSKIPIIKRSETYKSCHFWTKLMKAEWRLRPKDDKKWECEWSKIRCHTRLEKLITVEHRWNHVFLEFWQNLQLFWRESCTFGKIETRFAFTGWAGCGILRTQRTMMRVEALLSCWESVRQKQSSLFYMSCNYQLRFGKSSLI